MEDLAPVLAPTLGRLVRSPGTNLNWVAALFRRLDRDAPEVYDRFRRLYGLSRKIASLASFPPQDSALLGPACLFAALLDIAPPSSASSGAWLRYLRERPWAHYALQAGRTAHDVAAARADSRAAAAVTAAAVIDNEAVIRSANVLRALRELRALAATPELSRIAELLWTERGQSICDLHARHGSRTYVIEPAELADAIRLLEGERKAARSESARDGTAAHQPRKEDSSKTPAAAPATSEAFERRKRAIAEAHNLREAFGLAPTGPHREAAAAATRPEASTSSDGEPPERTDDLGTGARPADRVLPTIEVHLTPPPASEPASAAPILTSEERPMNDARPATASPAELDARLTASVEELRQQLAEIERLAAEGQQTLARLAPTIEGFAAMVAEFESVLSRWRGGRSEAA